MKVFNRKAIAGGVLAAVAGAMLVLSGCTGDTPKTPTPAQGPENPAVKQIKTRLYYPDGAGTQLIAIERQVGEAEKHANVVRTLLAGPKEAGLANPFPKGTQLKSVTVQDDLALVDFNENLTERFDGGSTAEEMLVASLVYSLTEFPEIRRVQILVEGKEIETIAGHLDTGEPFTRKDAQRE